MIGSTFHWRYSNSSISKYRSFIGLWIWNCCWYLEYSLYGMTSYFWCWWRNSIDFFQAFELVTGDFLFEPHSSDDYSRDEGKNDVIDDVDVMTSLLYRSYRANNRVVGIFTSKTVAKWWIFTKFSQQERSVECDVITNLVTSSLTWWRHLQVNYVTSRNWRCGL